MSDKALNTDDECVDPSFDVNSSIIDDCDFIAEKFCEHWATQLDHDNTVSLGLFLYMNN
jgi:hypothetical protein